MAMWLNWLKSAPSKDKIIKLMKEEGSLVGERKRGERKVFIYMLKNFFIQVMFRGDNPVHEVEDLMTFASLDQLNSHLEKEFRTAF